MAKFFLKQTGKEIQDILNLTPQIITKKENKTQFDLVGKENCLYIDDATNSLYRYSIENEEYIQVANYPYQKGIKSFFVGGNYDPLITRNFNQATNNIFSIPEDDPLSKPLIQNNIKYGFGSNTAMPGREYAIFMPVGSGGITDYRGVFFDLCDQNHQTKPFLRLDAIVYSKTGIFPLETDAATHNGLSLGVTRDGKIVRQSAVAKHEIINDHIRKISIIVDISKLYPHEKWGGTGVAMMLGVVITASRNINGVSSGDMIVTGIKGSFFATKLEAEQANILGDWETKKETSFVSTDQFNIEIENLKELIKTSQTPEDSFNDVEYNRAKISTFLNKWNNKIMNEYNELSINLCGDSIMGRQDNDSAIKNPTNYIDGKFTSSFRPQMAFTPDMNNPSESKFGYETGHVAPNMWEQLVGYRILKMLQYKDADVKYFRHDSSEVSKTGIWTSNFPSGADCLNHITSKNSNDSIEFTMPLGHTYCKFLYSDYGVFSNTTFKVEIWDSETQSYRSCASNNITYSHKDNGVNSVFDTLRKAKWAQINFKGFKENISYKIKITNTKNNNLTVWGFESWSKPHININITAQGGSTVPAHLDSMANGFYSPNYDNSLIIYEMPLYNDFGSGVVDYRKIEKTTDTPIPSPTEKTLYKSYIKGTLINFNNINVEIGDYVSYVNGKWINGMPYFINNTLKKYLDNLNECLYRLKSCGVDVLCIMPHVANWMLGRPFQSGIAYEAIRNMIASYGFAVIDTLTYQIKNNILNVTADSVHLNDIGSKLYADIINPIFNQTKYSNYPEIYTTPAVHSENVVSPYIFTMKNINSDSFINFPLAFVNKPFVSVIGSEEDANIKVFNITPEGFKIKSSITPLSEITIKAEIPYKDRWNN